ncbi:MAG: hypothetical protein ACLQGP_01775 [Isosphaeraceae bacterium]
MLDREIPTDRKAVSATDSGEYRELLRYPMTTSGDVLPFAPNLIATIVSFGFVLVVPWLVLLVSDWIHDRYDLLDDVDPEFFAFLAGIDILVALGVSLLFLVIGMILQFWQHQKPFASWWPFVLACPVVWGLLLPEAWVRGDSVKYWMLVGVAIAVAFSMHWQALMVAREAME